MRGRGERRREPRKKKAEAERVGSCAVGQEVPGKEGRGTPESEILGG